MYIKLFGYFLASAALFTSLAIALMGGRWQAVEMATYGGKRRPSWFVALSVLLIALFAPARLPVVIFLAVLAYFA